MPSYIVFANSDDGYLESTATTWAAAQAGSGTVTLNNSANFVKLGSNFASPNYFSDLAYFNFDTSSIAASEHIIEAMLKMTIQANNQSNPNDDTDVRVVTWTSPLTIAQWKNPNTVLLPALQFGAQYVQYYLQQGFQVQLSTGIGRPGDAVVKAGATRLVVGTATQLTNAQPAGNAYSQYASSNIGTADDPTLVVYSVKRDTQRLVNNAQAQLSTGEIVTLTSDGAEPNPVVTLGYYTKGTNTFNTIFAYTTQAVGGTNGNFVGNGGNQYMDVIVDPLDNIYVVGINASDRKSWLAQAFVKGSGLHWTQKTQLTYPNASGQTPQSIAATFITNTANPGYIWAVMFPEITTWQNPGNNLGGDAPYIVMSVASLLAGSGTLASSAQSLGAYQFAPIGPFDGLMRLIDTCSFTETLVDNDVICTAYGYKASGSSAMQIAWNVLVFNAAGGGVTAYNGTMSIANPGNTSVGPDSQIRLITCDGNKVALVFGESSGRHSVILIDTKGNGTLYQAINFSTQPDFSTSADWDAAYDPASGNVWVYYIDPTNNRRIARQSFNTQTGNWATSETTLTTTLGTAGGTNSKVKISSQITNGLSLVVEAASVTSGGVWSTSAVVDTYNNVPNAPVIAYIAPFDATTAKAITWAFSDPDKGDTQSAYAIEIDNNSTGVSAYRSGTVTSTASTATLPVNALSNNITYRIRISTKDSNGGQGPFSTYSLLQTSSNGTALITDPVADNPAGQIVANYLVKWTYTNPGAPTQQKYQLKMIRLSDGVTLYDSGLVTSTATQATVPNIPSNTPVRFDLAITSTTAQLTPTTSRLYTTNYSSPDQIVVLSATSGYASVALAWSIPGVTGSRPAASTYDVFRSIDNGVTWIGIVNLPAGSTSFIDNVVPSQCTPLYVVRSNAVNGYTWSVQATATAAISFLGIIISEQSQSLNNEWSQALAMFFGGPQNVETLAIASTQLQFSGRTYPVTEFGDNQTRSVAVAATVPFVGNPVSSLDDTVLQSDYQIRIGMTAVAEARATICMRDGRGRQVFGTITNLSVSDDIIGSKYTFEVDAVDFEEGSTVTNVTT